MRLTGRRVATGETSAHSPAFALCTRYSLLQSITHPDDHDVMALFAEALITRTPRRLWDVKTGRPASNSDVVEAIAVCERSIALANATGQPQHPAIAHVLIHALEMSNEPERAMASADTLATLCPEAGHMNHMPAHIYVLCGEYEKARIASDKAIRADDAFAGGEGGSTRR